jgi:hypothetical protein
MQKKFFSGHIWNRFYLLMQTKANNLLMAISLEQSYEISIVI